MNKNLEAKQKTVAEISEKLKSSKSVVVVSYSGITVAEVTDLRNKFRQAGVEYVVYKNNLVRRALDDAGIRDLDNLLEGPNAFAFGMKDPVSPAKVLSDFIGQSKDAKIKVKAGLVEGKYIDPAGINALAKLPSREVLIAKMMGSLNAPATNLVGVLSAMLRSLVYSLEAVRKQKAGE